MSGGHFDYQEYRISEIADSIECEIERACAPRPEKVPRMSVSIWKLMEPDGNCKRLIFHPEMPSVHAAVLWLERTEHCPLQQTEREGVYCTPYGDRYEIKEATYMCYPDGQDYPEWNERTIERMREAVKLLRQVQIYTHRIDYLLSGDDGEDTFHKRLSEELGRL